jgi:hypothetical protein
MANKYIFKCFSVLSSKTTFSSFFVVPQRELDQVPHGRISQLLYLFFITFTMIYSYIFVT